MMSKSKLWISLLVGVVCIVAAVWGVDWAEVWTSLRALKLSPLVGAFLMLAVTHWFRARRWGVLLRPIKEVGLWELFAINAVGFLSIHIFPFRLGELTRPLLFKKRHQISVSTGLACVAVERVFDGLVATGALLIGTFSIPLGRQKMSFIPVGVNALVAMAVAIFVPTLLFLVLAVINRDRALKVVDLFLKVAPVRYRPRLREIAENFFAGLRALPNIWSFLRILAESVGVWIVVAAAYWFGFQSFGLDLPWGASFLVLGIAAIGIMIPGPPGFVGTYQLFVQGALSLYGISRSTGLAYAIVIYMLNLAYVVGAGLMFLPALATPVRDLYAEATSEKNVTT